MLHGRETVAAGIPEGFRPVKPGRIAPGGTFAQAEASSIFLFLSAPICRTLPPTYESS
jgi:hypothetical protein